MGSKDNITRSINRLLDEQEVTKSEFAEAMNVSKAAVTYWTSGENSPGIEMIPEICDFFEITIDELFGYKISNQLSSEEKLLISLFRKMDGRGKAAVLSSARYLSRPFYE